jgi:hypothetical protein
MHVQYLHTQRARQSSRRQHLALWRWCGGSPGEECDVDSEAVRVILSTITGIKHTNMHVQFCLQTVGDSTWPSDEVFGAAAALASSATLTARRFALSYPTSQSLPYKHACFTHSEPAMEQSETAPGPLTLFLARQQPWRAVRHRQPGGPRHPVNHHRHHHPYASMRQNSRRQHLAL